LCGKFFASYFNRGLKRHRFHCLWLCVD
jgi:hypothetical protein